MINDKKYEIIMENDKKTNWETNNSKKNIIETDLWQSKMQQRWDGLAAFEDSSSASSSSPYHINLKSHRIIMDSFQSRKWSNLFASLCSRAKLAQWALIALILIKIWHQPFMAAALLSSKVFQFFGCNFWPFEHKNSRGAGFRPSFMAVLDSVRNSQF